MLCFEFVGLHIKICYSWVFYIKFTKKLYWGILLFGLKVLKKVYFLFGMDYVGLDHSDCAFLFVRLKCNFWETKQIFKGFNLVDILLNVSACKFRLGLLLSNEIFFEKVIIFSLIWDEVLVFSLVIENEGFKNGVEFNFS